MTLLHGSAINSYAQVIIRLTQLENGRYNHWAFTPHLMYTREVLHFQREREVLKNQGGGAYSKINQLLADMD